MATIKHVLTACLAGMALLSCPLIARGGDSYYFALLTSEGDMEHALPLLIKATEEDGKKDFETHVNVSASPVRGPESWRAYPDKTVPLEEVLKWTYVVHGHLIMRGPYPISKEVYDRRENARGDEARGVLLFVDARAGASIDPRMAAESIQLLAVRGVRPWFAAPGKAPDWLRDRLKVTRHADLLSIQN